MNNVKILGIFILVLFVFFPFGNILAQNHPDRLIEIYTPFTKIEISTGQKISFDIEFSNKGDINELMDIMVLGPRGWETTLMCDNYVIKSLYIKYNESLNIDFVTIPQNELEAGNYTFIITAMSRDKVIEASIIIEVELSEATATSGIYLSTPYPSIEGPSDQNYEFRLDVKNLGNEPTIIDFIALYPEDWLVSFRPRYEDRLIRSLDFQPGEMKTIMVTISPPPDALPEEYNITVVTSTGDIREKLSFNILIIGIYAMSFKSTDGLLSFDAIQGKEKTVTLLFNNTGTAPLEDVVFFSDKPQGWDVKIEPSEIPLSDPGAFREVRVNIKPPNDAIPGDYILTLYSAVAKRRLSEQLNFRVSVKGSVSWGFLGLGIIIAMIITLVVIFLRLGRR